MRRTLVLFVRVPLLGSGKRRLAREIGDIAALRFEKLMIALLLRRLAKDGRWRLRIAVTPGKARRRASHWCGALQKSPPETPNLWHPIHRSRRLLKARSMTRSP